jgi:hypothetical protein
LQAKIDMIYHQQLAMIAEFLVARALLLATEANMVANSEDEAYSITKIQDLVISVAEKHTEATDIMKKANELTKKPDSEFSQKVIENLHAAKKIFYETVGLCDMAVTAWNVVNNCQKVIEKVNMVTAVILESKDDAQSIIYDGQLIIGEANQISESAKMIFKADTTENVLLLVNQIKNLKAVEEKAKDFKINAEKDSTKTKFQEKCEPAEHATIEDDAKAADNGKAGDDANAAEHALALAEAMDNLKSSYVFNIITLILFGISIIVIAWQGYLLH